MRKAPVLILACALITGCAGAYGLKGYDLGCAASKNIYGNSNLGLDAVPTNYTGVSVNAAFHFGK